MSNFSVFPEFQDGGQKDIMGENLNLNLQSERYRFTLAVMHSCVV